jgi:bacterioferritin-associated ferredoxin
MNTCCTRDEVGSCSSRLVCRCLRVTESVVLNALTTGGARSLKELRQETGAGDGCTACHRLLRGYLERHFPEKQSA